MTSECGAGVLVGCAFMGGSGCTSNSEFSVLHGAEGLLLSHARHGVGIDASFQGVLWLAGIKGIARTFTLYCSNWNHVTATL